VPSSPKRKAARDYAGTIIAAFIFGFAPGALGYNSIVGFGDSYTDTGNIPSSPPYYWNGRFSNGPLWIEYLSQSLGFGYNAANNLAVSGSESDELGNQIDNYPGTGDPANVLFAIWSGNNDFQNHLNYGYDDDAWDTKINDLVYSLTTASDLLYQKGARDVVIFNQFDLTQIPDIHRQYDDSFRSYILGKIQIFNSRVANALPNLINTHPGLQVRLLDIYSAMNNLLANYGSFGFRQAQVDALDDPNLSDKSFSGPGANYVFWDLDHPTSKTHGIVATWVSNLLGASSVNPGTTPSPPWHSQDIGAVGQPGSSYYATNGTFTVAGSGSDIWDTADAFQYLYQSFSGDGTVIARITGVQDTDGFAKACLMFRESLDPGARNVAEFITPEEGAGFQWRANTGGPSDYEDGLVANTPYWLKLQRAGNAFNGYTSADGSNWTLTGSVNISMATSVYIGLAVTAHNNSLLNTSTFQAVQIISAAIRPGISLTSLPDGSVQLTVSGSIGGTYRCDASADLKTWTPISTNVLSSASVVITDAQARSMPQRFYRAALMQ
jgi:phospholipase/lecithinase/hemolysin